MSQLPLILRTVLLTILAVAILASAIANGYFYFKSEETNAKIDLLQQDISAIKGELLEANQKPKIGNIQSALVGIDSKLITMQSDIDDIQSDVEETKSNVSSIESDVSSIQLKIGY